MRKEQNEKSLVPASRFSLISRIRKLFLRENNNSEIGRIAEGLLTEDDKELFTDKKTKVYDFFRDNRYYLDQRTKSETEESIKFINAEGQEKIFMMCVDKYGRGIISIDGCKIEAYRKLSDGYDIGGDGFIDKDAMTECLNLIKYNEFINSVTNENRFINELGIQIELASKKYNPHDRWSPEKAGKYLYKSLKRNPVYKEMKKSFDRAYKEYKKTFVEFRQNEKNEETKSNQGKTFLQELKAEKGNEQPRNTDFIGTEFTKEDKEPADD